MKKSKPTKLIILDILIFVAAFVFAMSLIYLANSIKESKEQRFHKKDVQRVLTSGEYKRIIDIADYYKVIKRDTSDEMINDLYGQADYIKAAFMYNAYKNSGKDDLADECKKLVRHDLHQTALRLVPVKEHRKREVLLVVAVPEEASSHHEPQRRAPRLYPHRHSLRNLVVRAFPAHGDERVGEDALDRPSVLQFQPRELPSADVEIHRIPFHVFVGGAGDGRAEPTALRLRLS